MAFETFADFLSMTGVDGRSHGLYVWSAYFVAAGVIAFNLISPRLQRKRIVNEFQRKLRREQP